MPHQQLLDWEEPAGMLDTNSPEVIYNSIRDSLLHAGTEGSGDIGGFNSRLRSVWNQPEKLRTIVEEGPGEVVSFANVNVYDEKLESTREAARARLHELATQGPTPSPLLGQDLGMDELQVAEDALREGEDVRQALRSALEADHADADADVKGPLSTGEVEFHFEGIDNPDQVQSRAREIAQDMGLVEPPQPDPQPSTSTRSPAPSPSSAGSSPLSRAGLIAAAAAVLGVGLLVRFLREVT